MTDQIERKIGEIKLTDLKMADQNVKKNQRHEISRPENDRSNFHSLKVDNWQTNILHVYTLATYSDSPNQTATTYKFRPGFGPTSHVS